MTHRNMIALLATFFHGRSPNDLDAHVALFTLPLYHIFGLFMLLKGFVLGETLVIMERFEFQAMLRAVEKYRVTTMPISPPIVVMLVKSQLTEQYDLRSLQTLTCGGAPLGRDISEQFKVKFPRVELVQGYAMTESGGGARMLGPDETKRYGSVGRLGENLEARIVDPVSGEALPPGQKGELWLRGPCIMKGYIGDEKATAETLSSDGWLKTGDLCYFDSEGFLYIVDRLKELIKYKGYQVPPVELESLLQSHHQISDAAVIPYPDEEAGQIPMAFVVRKPESDVNESQIIDFIAKQVSPHKKIRRVAFIDSIPKSPAGKILRRQLVDIAVSNRSAKL